MSDDELVVSGERADPEALSYDFAKYLGTLALLLLGGVLSLTQASDGRPADRGSTILIIALLSLGGVVALTTANSIVESRLKRRAVTPRLRLYTQISLISLGMGVGAFLSTWIDRL